MTYRKFKYIGLFLLVFAAVILLIGGSDQASAKPKPKDDDKCAGNSGKHKGQGECPRITHDDRESAAARAFQEGLLNPLMMVDEQGRPQQGALNSLMADTQAAADLIDGAPHYFSHPNYANSELPTITGPGVVEVGNPLIERTYASDFGVGAPVASVFVLIPTPMPDGLLQSFQMWNQADPGGSPFPSAGNRFHAYVLRPTGTPNEYIVVFDSGLLTVPALTNPGVSEVATFPVADLAVQAGDILGIYGQGIPLDIGGVDTLHYPALTPPLQDSTITLGSTAFPIHRGQAYRTYSFGAQVLDGSTITEGGIRKFVDGLAGLGPTGENNLGQYISVAAPDQTTYSTANGFGADADY